MHLRSLQIDSLNSQAQCGTAKSRIHNHLSYKLGQALIQANKTWYKGGYVRLWFEIRRMARWEKK
ncbi:hypothetical protein [Helicobacter pullorum]|uniref:hypothetical protein n=1 Tax=Helicobacter pullorum TaxID=35818 RepID=UPI00242B5A6E|nr:hypothetical protein [Helicobacter pullorum]